MRSAAGWALGRRLGRKDAHAVVEAADHLYVPPPALARTSPGRSNLTMAAYLIALRDAIAEIGVESAHVNERLAADLHRVMRVGYAPLEVFAAATHPRDAMRRTRFRQRFAQRMLFKSPDWVMEDVPAARGCYGFDIRRCVLAEYMRSRGEAVFCEEVLCSQDRLMARSRGERLVRTKTIAGGADRCDFRFIGHREAESPAVTR